MSDINFVEKDRRKIERTQRQDKRAFLVFFLLVITILLVLAVLLGVRIYHTNKNNRIKANIERAKQRLTAENAREAQYLVFYHKLGNLASVLHLRHDHTGEAVWSIGHFEDQVIKVKSVTYDLFAQELKLVLQAYSVFYFQDVLDALAREEVQGRYDRVENLGLTRDANGYYNLTVSLGLK